MILHICSIYLLEQDVIEERDKPLEEMEKSPIFWL